MQRARQAGGRGDDEDEADSDSRQSSDRSEVRPGHPSQEKNGECDDHEHDSRAEVGLQEDESRRSQSQRQDANRLADGRAAAGALDHERRQGDDEQQLGQLGGLEAEVGKLDPAARPSCGRAEEQHQADRADHQRVDADADLAEARIVDLGHREHQGDADQRINPLAHREEQRLARDVVGSRDREREAAERDQGQRSAEEPAVEVRRSEAFAEASPPGSERERCCFHELGMPFVPLGTSITTQGSGRRGSCCHHSCVLPEDAVGVIGSLK